MPGDVVKKIEITAALSSDYQAAFAAAGNIAKSTGSELAALNKREADLQKLSALSAQKAAAEASGNEKAVARLSSQYAALSAKLGLVGGSAADVSSELSKIAGKKGALLDLKKAASARAELGKLSRQIRDVSTAYKTLKDPALAKHLDSLRARYKALGGEVGRAGVSVSSFAARCAAMPGPVGGVASSLLNFRSLLSGPAGIAALVGGVAVAAVAATKALFDLGIEAAKSGDAIQKQADALGISTDAYQELSYAMQRGGATEAEFTAGLKALQSQMAAAASGNSRAIKAFGALGISLSEVKSLNAEEMFARISDGLAAMDDPALRVRTGIQLLGGSGEKLAFALSDGSEALADLRKRARSSGFVRTRGELDAAAQATDAFLDAQLSAQTALREVGTAVLPTVCDMLRQFASFVNENRDGIREFASVCGSLFSAVGSHVSRVFGAIGTAIEVSRNGIAWWADAFSSAGDSIVGAVSAVKEGIVSVFSGVADYIIGLYDRVVDFILSIPDRVSSALSDLPLVGRFFGDDDSPAAVGRAFAGAGPQIVINNNIDARGGDSSTGSGVRRALSESAPTTAGAVSGALGDYGDLAVGYSGRSR